MAEHENAERQVTGHLSPGADPLPAQLTIFTPLSQPVIERLREVNLDRLTPLESLNLLAELKKQIDDGCRPMPRQQVHLQLGQLLIIGFDGTEMSPRLASLLTRLQPAGVILFARNITGGEQTYNLLKDCQACVATPLFTSVDMEGGRVDRFRNLIGSAPSAADVFDG